MFGNNIVEEMYRKMAYRSYWQCAGSDGVINEVSAVALRDRGQRAELWQANDFSICPLSAQLITGLWYSQETGAIHYSLCPV